MSLYCKCDEDIFLCDKNAAGYLRILFVRLFIWMVELCLDFRAIFISQELIEF